MNLTAPQLQFIERHVLKRRMDALGLDPVGLAQDTGPTAQQLTDDAAVIRTLLVDYGTAADVDPLARVELQKLMREGEMQLALPLTHPGVTAANRIAMVMKDTHEAAVADLVDRKRLADDLRLRIAGLVVEHAAGDEAISITTLAADLTAGWPNPPTRAQVQTAEDRLPTLRDLVENIRLAVAARALERTQKLAEIDNLDEKLADEAERGAIGLAQGKARAALPEHPTATDLQTAEGLIGLLKDEVARVTLAVDLRRKAAILLRAEIEDCTVANADEGETQPITEAQISLRQALSAEAPSAARMVEVEQPLTALKLLAGNARLAVAARVKRRDEILEACKLCAVDLTIKAESEKLLQARAGLPVLDGFPGRETLRLAEIALVTLQEAAISVRSAVEARVQFCGKADLALKSVVWGAGALVPHGDAPPGLTEPVKQLVDKLQLDHANLTDPAKADLWPTTEAGGLDLLLQTITLAKADLEKSIGAINLAMTEIAKARQEATALVDATGVFALSVDQKQAFANLIDAAAKLLVADIGQANSAVVALRKVGSDALALQQALRGLMARISAVNITPLNASDKEKAALDLLRKQAVDALGKVEP